MKMSEKFVKMLRLKLRYIYSSYEIIVILHFCIPKLLLNYLAPTKFYI